MSRTLSTVWRAGMRRAMCSSLPCFGRSSIDTCYTRMMWKSCIHAFALAWGSSCCLWHWITLYLLPGCWWLQRQHYIRRFKWLIQIVSKHLEVFMGCLFDNQSSQLSKLCVQEWLDYNTISINGLFMQPQEHIKSCIDPLFQPSNLIFLDEIVSGKFFFCRVSW